VSLFGFVCTHDTFQTNQKELPQGKKWHRFKMHLCPFSDTRGVALASRNHRLGDVTAPQYLYGFPRNKHPVWGGHQETVERMGNTSHQAPSTKHQAPSTKHQAPSTKHQAPSTALLQ
jgi:hypothetical protein